MEHDDPIDFGCGFLFRSPERLPRVRTSPGVVERINERLPLILSLLAKLKAEGDGFDKGNAVNKIELELLTIKDEIASLGVKEPSLGSERSEGEPHERKGDDEFLERCGIFPF